MDNDLFQMMTMAYPEEMDILMSDDKLFESVLDAINVTPPADVVPMVLGKVNDFQKLKNDRELVSLQVKDFQDAMARDSLNVQVIETKDKLESVLKSNGITKDMERALRLGAHDAANFSAAKMHIEHIGRVQTMITALSNVTPSLSNQAIVSLLEASQELLK